MNIFVTLDRNYLEPLKVMLGSLLLNNFGAQIELKLLGYSARERRSRAPYSKSARPSPIQRRIEPALESSDAMPARSNS